MTALSHSIDHKRMHTMSNPDPYPCTYTSKKSSQPAGNFAVASGSPVSALSQPSIFVAHRVSQVSGALALSPTEFFS